MTASKRLTEMNAAELQQTIKDLDLFAKSSTDFIAKFAAHAVPKNARKGEVILHPGVVNERFLILVSGSVEVIVKGETVATLSQPGDLMGEMSALTGWIVTASLKAVDEVEYFELSAADLKARIEQSKDGFGYELYRLLAQVLSEKIIRTNEKARQFEIANRSLSETMDLLQETQRTIDRRVRERVIGTSLQSSRVLLVEAEKKQQNLAKLSLGGLGSQIEIAANAAEALKLVSANPNFDLIFLNLTEAHLLPQLRSLVNAQKIVVMAPNDRSQDIDLISQNTKLISNLISKNPDDRNLTVRNMTLAATKLLGQDIFGLEKYLMWGVEVQSRAVTCSDQRAQLIEEMQSYFKDLGVRSTISDRAATVAEELLMNAIYDAPTNEKGEHIYNHLPRTTRVELDKHQQAEFRYACDGMWAAISTNDQAGALTIDVLVDYLKRNSNPQISNPQLSGKGGAGRGLHMIMESSDLVVFNVGPKKRTEAVALFSLDPRTKDEALSPLFHFFIG